MLLSCYC